MSDATSSAMPSSAVLDAAPATQPGTSTELPKSAGQSSSGPGLAGRPVKVLGLIAALLAALGALLVEGELELTLFMAAAVICSLACFDAALDRRIDAFWPWMLVSVGILGKTVPTVVSRLSDHIGPNAERFDHMGSVLLGLCIAGVTFLLARPPAGAEQRNPISGIVALVGLAGAVAGASVAFAGASGLGSARAARVFETIGWGTSAAILAGVAIAVGGSLRPPLPLLALVTGSLGVAILGARTASGVTVDLGWWALAFFVMGAGSLGFAYASLGQRSGRRTTLAPTVVAVLAAVLSIQATILAATNGTWGPGLFLLPLLALALLGLGLLLYRWGGTNEIDIDDESASVFDMIADSNLEGDVVPEPAVPAAAQAPAPEPAAAAAAFAEAAAADVSPVVAPITPEPAPVAATGSAFRGAIAGPASDPAPAPLERVPERAPAPVAAPEPVAAQTAAPAPPAPAPPAPAAAQPPAPQPAAAAATPAPPAEAAPEPVPQPVAVPTAPVSTSTEGLAPHLVDPTTGLRSVAGLQAVLIDAFGRPRQANEVSIVMVALRNLGTIEETHGRVAAARVTSELANRFSSRLPDAYTARFASDAFAAVIDGAPLDAQALIPRCADVLSELLEPIAIGEHEIEIDVAASMAQCYANEDIAGFIGRANTGLERAVAAAEPSLIAMP